MNGKLEILPDNQPLSYRSGTSGTVGRANQKLGTFGGDSVRQTAPQTSHRDYGANGNLPKYGPNVKEVSQTSVRTEDLDSEEQNEMDELEGPEGIPLSENITQDDCKNFLRLNLDAAIGVLDGRSAPAQDVEEFKNDFTKKINSFQLRSKNGTSRPDLKQAKTEITDFKNDVQSSMKSLLRRNGKSTEGLKHEQGEKIQNLLSEKPIWENGYDYKYEVGATSEGGTTNSYRPLGAKTCHHFTTQEPTNAWKTSLKFPDKSSVAFYRNGTFAPQPKKAGEDWDDTKIQTTANTRAKEMAEKMVEDHLQSLPESERENAAKKGYTFSNLDLMRRSLYDWAGGENELSEVHGKAVESLGGATIQVQVDGKAYNVKLGEPRRWMQDLKDAPYFANSKKAQTANEKAFLSLDRDIQALKLHSAGKTGDQALQKDIKNMNLMRDTLRTQLDYQKRPAISRLFRAIGRGVANLFGAKMKSPIMDPSETSALIIALETTIAKYKPGGISEGCKSGKDRGSLVDVAAKAFLSEINRNNGEVKGPMLRPGWMMKRAKEDATFRKQLNDLFLANYPLQQANTGLKGYITSDAMTKAFGWASYTNYMEDLAKLVMTESHSIKAGSGMVKS